MFSIIKKGTEEEFLKHLNKVRPSIKFTMELESNNTLPFLYCLIHRKEGGQLEVLVYRKPAYTNQYYVPTLSPVLLYYRDPETKKLRQILMLKRNHHSFRFGMYQE